jgi:hypothetical protein
MKPLLFILSVTGLCVLGAIQFGSEVTWFNYYVGGVAGLLVSGAALGAYSKRKRLREEEENRKKNRR